MRKGRREIGSNVSIMRGERLNQVHFQYHRINQDLRQVRIRYLECVYLSSYRHYSLFFLWPLSYVTAIAPPYPDANTLGSADNIRDNSIERWGIVYTLKYNQLFSSTFHDLKPWR